MIGRTLHWCAALMIETTLHAALMIERFGLFDTVINPCCAVVPSSSKQSCIP
jgi:hypothetical protein